MAIDRLVSLNQQRLKRGGGIASSALSLLNQAVRHIPVGTVINRAIDALPIELHIPGGYQYCGPGTKLKERLKRGDPGINKLDKACKDHDIAYSKFSDSTNRSIADRVLAEKAWQRVTSSDASIGERTAALAVSAAMKGKTALGSSYKTKRRARRRRVKKKRGAGVRRRRRQRRSGNKKKIPILMKMLKTGNGLYLRPYNVY